jgi:hypothetical protein
MRKVYFAGLLKHSGYGFEILMAEYCRRSFYGVVKINL